MHRRPTRRSAPALLILLLGIVFWHSAGQQVRLWSYHEDESPLTYGTNACAYYQAGHMMYVRRADHEKFRDDYLRFMRSALEAGE